MRGANQHKQTPGGLLLPVSATLKGRVRWQVLDERGLPEVPRSPSGFALAPAEGVEQPNLITDLGLDQIAAFDCFGTSPSTSGTWRRYLAVGTGSTTPANGDTTLAAEVQRAASSGSFSNGSTAYALDDTNDVWRAESLVTRLVTMNADRNIAEFGLSPESSGAIGIRELLRDSEGNPITVSLLDGKTLRVDHTLTVEIAAPAAGHSLNFNINEFDAGNNPIGSTAYAYTFGMSPKQDNETLIAQCFDAWNPSSTTTTTIGVKRLTSRPPYARIGTMTSDGLSDPSAGGNSGLATFTRLTYVGGTYSRTRRATVPAGSGNDAWYGFVIMQLSPIPSYPNGRHSGWFALFDSPATYTKQNTDTLRVGFVSTWARAA